jgi:hypothetical protein
MSGYVESSSKCYHNTEFTNELVANFEHREWTVYGISDPLLAQLAGAV